jgi:hypothetical protein
MKGGGEDADLVECPYCSLFLEAGAEAEAHVAAHEAEADPLGDAGRDGMQVDGSSGGRTMQEKQQQDEHWDAAAAGAAALAEGVACGVCGAVVDLADLDSHEEAHRLQQLEGQLRTSAAAAEAQSFQALQQMYGFADGVGAFTFR